MAKKKQFTTKHKVLGVFFRPIYRLVAHCAFNIKINKLKLDGPTLILSNHQTDLDAIIIMGAANKHVETVCLDTLLSNGFTSKFLHWVTGLIPKKKGAVDVGCVVKMMQCLKEGGNVLVFPEGNRTYAEFQYHFSDSVLKLAKKTNSSLVVMNIHNGTGVSPRWCSKKRKGKMSVDVKARYSAQEVKAMSDDELLEKVRRDLVVFDSDSGVEYRSKAPAEYLERLLYVCPECKSLSTLRSEGDKVKCSSCGTSLTYKENLTFEDNKYGFHKLVDWYVFQKNVVKEKKIELGQLIFEDEIEDVFEYELLKKRKPVASGSIKLYENKLVLGNSVEIDLSTISAASPISDRKLSLVAGDKNYLIVGNERFNPVKYVHMFNKLKTEIKRKHLDEYFSLE